MPRPSLKSGTALKANSIGVFGSIVMCMAFMGPAISVAYNTPAAAAGAGFALPLSILLAMLACLLVANSVAAVRPQTALSRLRLHLQHPRPRPVGRLPVRLAHGHRLRNGRTDAHRRVRRLRLPVHQLPVPHPHPWWVVSICFMLVIWAVLAAGVSESAKVATVFLAVEVTIITALTVTIIAKGGATGLSLGNFNPANSLKGISGLGTGMLWGILMFIGFESVATLGEEAKGSRKTIPRALFTAVLVIGSFYVFAAYGSSTGFGPHGVKAFVADGDPWSTLSQKYWGGTALLVLTILASALANAVSGSNSVVRILFAMGRESILPRQLGHTSKKGVPQVALGSLHGLLARLRPARRAPSTGRSAYGGSAEPCSGWA